MTMPPRSVSFPGESIFMEKDSFHLPRRGVGWRVTAGTGRAKIGPFEENLNSRRVFIRRTQNYSRFFSLLTGRFPTARSTSKEARQFTSASARTITGNFTLFIFDQRRP